MKLNYGPWESTAWWQKQKSAALEFAALASEADPLVQSLLGHIRGDLLADLESSLEEVPDAEVLAHVQAAECWKCKGPSVALR
eukprot:10795088-Lingulodinium_polyedra.AAC.1